MRTRDYRRYMKWVKFKKRVYKWTNSYDKSFYVDNNLREEIFKGEEYTFLRTTGRPCNCWMCTYEKYERPPKHIIQKEMWEEFNDTIDLL